MTTVDSKAICAIHHTFYTFPLYHVPFNQTGIIRPFGNDEADAPIETAAPDDQTLSSDSREDRDPMIFAVTGPDCFFGTHILALEEPAAIGGTIFVPAANILRSYP